MEGDLKPGWRMVKFGIGLSSGRLTTKIHAVVDSLGNPIRLKLTGGNAHDSLPALDFIGGLAADNVIDRRA